MGQSEFLVATLKPKFRDKDLEEVMRWNSEYHRARGVTGVRYFVSEDRRSFIMWVPRAKRVGDRLQKEWEASGAETSAGFRSMTEKVFESGRGQVYREVRPPRARRGRPAQVSR
jgi:hypothetical protein